MSFFTPFQDGDPGRAETLNIRFREMETAINARHGAMTPIIPWTVLSVDAADIVVDFVTQEYAVLALMLAMRTNEADYTTSLIVRINDDTTSANYTANGIRVSGSGISSASLAGNAIVLLEAATGSFAPTDRMGWGHVRLSNADLPIPKPWTFETSGFISGSSWETYFGGGQYAGSNPVTRLRIAPNINTLSLVAGSQYALYGMA